MFDSVFYANATDESDMAEDSPVMDLIAPSGWNETDDAADLAELADDLDHFDLDL